MLQAFKTPLDAWTVRTFYAGMEDDPLLQAFYGDSGHANLGYWDTGIATAHAAGDRLVDRLVELVGARPARTLDVACGWGATTARLGHHFGAETIDAINISRDQIEVGRARAPASRFHHMDATALDFAPESFGAVVCVEAAFHFDTRRDFFEQAFRVLEPGGRLALSDLLMAPATPTVPLANHVADHDAYAALLESVGFVDVAVEGVMAETIDAYRLRLSDFITETRDRFGWYLTSRDLMYLNVTLPAVVRDSILVAATKPAG